MKTTINYRGIDFDVDFDYQPCEPMEMYDSDGSGYPGAPDSVEGINEITHKETCFLEFFDGIYLDELILESLQEK